MPTITTFLTFNDRAAEAADFYTAIFPNSRILETTHYPDAMPGMAGKVMTVTFELDGQHYTALNGGASFSFSQGVSLMVLCKTQDEIDHYWTRLGEGGQEHACGWLSDKFGLSWQITPARLMDLINNPETVDRAFGCMGQMVKFDLAAIEAACAEA